MVGQVSAGVCARSSHTLQLFTHSSVVSSPLSAITAVASAAAPPLPPLAPPPAPCDLGCPPPVASPPPLHSRCTSSAGPPPLLWLMPHTPLYQVYFLSFPVGRELLRLNFPPFNSELPVEVSRHIPGAHVCGVCVCVGGGSSRPSTRSSP